MKFFFLVVLKLLGLYKNKSEPVKRVYVDYKDYINSVEWFKKREVRRKYDNNKCLYCGSEERLEVHHCHYETLGSECPYDDLITLCRKHHQQVHDYQDRYQWYLMEIDHIDAIKLENDSSVLECLKWANRQP